MNMYKYSCINGFWFMVSVLFFIGNMVLEVCLTFLEEEAMELQIMRKSSQPDSILSYYE